MFWRLVNKFSLTSNESVRSIRLVTMILFIFLFCVVVLLLSYYINGKTNEEYWKKRGVAFFKGNKVFGPFWGFVTQDRSLFEFYHDIYKLHRNEPAVGIGTFVTPTLYVIDPINVQYVLQSDFNSFSNRGLELNYENDLLADNVLFMNGNRWKLMRQSITPLFTSSKLKNMFYILDKSAQDFVQLLNDNPKKLEGKVFDTLSSYCSAAIGASVFGITTESVFESPFLAMAREAFAPTAKQNIRFAVGGAFPTAIRKLRLCLFKDHEDLFIGAIKKVLRQREKENVKKHDFADICLSIQKNGTMKDRDTGFELEPTDELLAAQGFFFFAAGVEPTATAMFGVLIELGLNPDILQKVHKEIDETFNKYDRFTYDVIMGMEYLGKVLNEGLRKYPPIGFLTRKCVRDTVLPVGNIKVSKNTQIITPIFELHRDPKIYDNPDKFDPERFAQDNTNADITYQPFGKGGRVCIGMRYAKLQVLVGLVYLLRKFTVKTTVGEGGIKFSKQTVQVRPVNVDLKFIPRN